jgi:hypothetical protein
VGGACSGGHARTLAAKAGGACAELARWLRRQVSAALLESPGILTSRHSLTCTPQATPVARTNDFAFQAQAHAGWA